jgi:hypothetical protein
VSFAKHGHRPPLAGVPGGGSPLPSVGDRCRSGGSGHARAVWGVTRPAALAHLPDDGPVMPSEISKRGAHPCPEGNCGGNTRPAAGSERTLMGPAAQRSRRPQKRLSPHAGPSAETNERARGWKVGLRPGGSKKRPQGGKRGSRFQAEHAADRGRQTTWPKPAAPASPLLGVLQRSSNQQVRRPVPATGATRAAFAQANRCTQTRQTGGGRHRMTGATADRRVGRLGGISETSDPFRPQPTP